MEKLQYDSFYKFLISLGILLILSPCFFIYFFLSFSDKMFISNAQLVEMSSTSLVLLNKRDDLLLFVIKWVPLFFIFLLFVGIFLFFYGAIKWRTLQKEYDKQIFLTTEEKKLKIESMTPTEVYEKNILETEKMELSKISNKKAPFLKAMHVENFCYFYISNRLSSSYKVYQNVKAMDMAFDIMAISKKQDILYEVKYWTQIPSFQKFRESITCFLKYGLKYKAATAKKTKLIFLIVLPDAKYEQLHSIILSYSERINLQNMELQFLTDVEIGE